MRKRITSPPRYDYDGNKVSTDNWENLNKFPLTASAYYSVVETCSHWYIVYGFFHPRDWTDSRADQEHENDLEGLLSIVRKDGTRFGKLEGMVTVYHTDFYSYTPPGSPFSQGKETLDGRLTLQQYEGALRPLTVQQAKDHGLKAFPYTSDFRGKPNEDGIIYYPTRTPESQFPKVAMTGMPHTVSSIFSPLEGCGTLDFLKLKCRAQQPKHFINGGVQRGQGRGLWKWDNRHLFRKCGKPPLELGRS